MSLRTATTTLNPLMRALLHHPSFHHLFAKLFSKVTIAGDTPFKSRPRIAWFWILILAFISHNLSSLNQFFSGLHDGGK